MSSNNHTDSEQPALQSSTKDFEKALLDENHKNYFFKLYVAGMTPKSQRAITNLHMICETHLQGHYELEVIDIYQQPLLAKQDQVIAVPTLIKQLPLPLRKFIGDLSRTELILAGLEIIKKPL
ncbi:MAG: circadian clock KaiB family protein [Methylococcales bacterium]